MSSALRLGLIGCGNISGVHVQAARAHRQNIELRAVCDVDAVRAHRTAEEFDSCQVFTDWERMLADAQIDAVTICLPHAQHLEVGLAALRSGRHALIEKPMACTADEGVQLVAAAEQAGVTLMAAQHQRYDPTYRRVHQLIADGSLGTIHAARFDCMQTLRAYTAPGHWLYDAAIAGGGVIISLAVHRLDLLRYLLDDEVTSVQAMLRTHDPAFLNGAEDYSVGTLQCDKGTIAEFFATYAGYRMPYGESFMLFGAQGAVHALPPVGEYVGPAMIAMEGAPETAPIRAFDDQYTGFARLRAGREDLPTDNPYENEVLHFVECCRTGALPLSSGRDNVRTLALVDAIYKSGRSETTVQPVEHYRQ